MRALVFVGYFDEVLKASLRYKDSFFRILITDSDVSKILSESIVDETIIVEDFTKVEIMDPIIKEISEMHGIKYIYANIEWAVEICGYLRKKYKIDGLALDACLKTRDKYLMKKEVEKRGIRTAKVELLNCYDDIVEFARKNEYPIVLKPRKGAATQNTFVIKSENELGEIYTKIEDAIDSYIVESFNKGEEYHCDSVIVDGKVIFSSVSKYYSNLIDTINTDVPVSGVVFPESCNNLDVVRKIKEMNEKVIDALKIDRSICHLEVFVTENNECIFGEIASRIGGGPLIGNAIRHAYGINLYEIFVDLGIKKEEFIQITKDCFAGYLALPIKSGRITQIPSEEDYANEVDIKQVKIFNKVGDVITSKDNTVKRTGYLIVTGRNLFELQSRLIELYQNFDIKVESRGKSMFSIFA